MASAEDLRTFDRRMDPHRTTIGEERNVIKGVYKEMRKAGIDPSGFKDAKRYGKLTPTQRSARLKTFLESMEAFGYSTQIEMPFGVIQGGKADEPVEEETSRGRGRKTPGALHPRAGRKTRGKGPLNAA